MTLTTRSQRREHVLRLLILSWGSIAFVSLLALLYIAAGGAA